MEKSIADLHCDLLSYLAEGQGRTAFDKAVRCSIPQLHAGGVSLQTLAVYTQTGPNSSQFGMRQIDIFKKLPQIYPDTFEIINRSEHIHPRLKRERIGIMLAIENISSLCGENEDLSLLFQRIETIEKSCAKIIYMSLTWNEVNRFGGGGPSNFGLKKDGEEFLNFLDGKKIALDFSHASDKLIEDSLNYIDQKNLNIPIIASHSNMRSVEKVSRNLPDHFAKEIISRNGVIGLNFVKPFVGADGESGFTAHIDHIIKLGGEQNLCFGADFFYDQDQKTVEKYQGAPLFFPDFGSAHSYNKILQLAHNNIKLADQCLENISFANLRRFLINNIF